MTTVSLMVSEVMNTMLLRLVVYACTKLSAPELIPYMHQITSLSTEFGLIRLRLVLLSSCIIIFRSAMECSIWIVSRTLLLLLFFLLDTIVNYLSQLSLRAATFSAKERWHVQGVPSITFSGESSDGVWIGCIVSFAGFGSQVLCY